MQFVHNIRKLTRDNIFLFVIAFNNYAWELA